MKLAQGLIEWLLVLRFAHCMKLGLSHTTQGIKKRTYPDLVHC